MPALVIDGATKNYERGTTYEAVAQEYQSAYQNNIALVVVNGKMRELSKRVDRDGYLTFITTKDAVGHRTYGRTAVMMLVKVVNDLFGKDVHTRVEFAIGNGYFISLRGLDAPVDGEMIARIEEAMLSLAERNAPIIKKTYPLDDAIELFARQGMWDKEKLFRFRRSSTVNVYNLEGYYDYYYGYMMPSTGYVRHFHVEPYEDGMILLLPPIDEPNEVMSFRDQPSLFQALDETTEWGDRIGLTTVGELNEEICEGDVGDLILVQEALCERRIGEIAEEISELEDVRFVLIAGPTSSGKTTFANRISVQLRSFGLIPHIISVDDYFVNREQTPIDIDGNYDYECLEAIDLELFNDDMSDLLDGKEVEIPSYNFKTGRREYKGRKLVLGDEDVLVIEGIHCLNPKATEGLPDDSKYRIYISALASLNIDEHNRIPSTDLRLLRRMVRDARTRGYNAQQTMEGWAKVRAGEEKYIFPYQDLADVVFNSVMIYEPAIIKQFAEPLLYTVDSRSPVYIEAKRLLKFLEYFLGADSSMVPGNSILREFIGGGCFRI